ncbi:unnamed protein product [Brassica rapa]|uniref:Uncharacterized protein n=1 Tax=Brassica campestris TaxID=3711 RepID=A0A8D9CRA8_BRACM|nr:unnamed protein product [Brassica rapa]
MPSSNINRRSLKLKAAGTSRAMEESAHETEDDTSTPQRIQTLTSATTS